MGKKFSKRRRTNKSICLWGCSDLTLKEIESFILMKVKEIIDTEKSNILFKSYLQSTQTADESVTLKYLEFYEISNRIQSDSTSLQDDLPQLLETCPEEIWKQKINDARAVDGNIGNNQQLKQVLNELKEECLDNIEHERDFEEFFKELRNAVK